MSNPTNKPVVLIGPLADDPAESVSAVNRALIAGLGDQYSFVASRTRRRFGNTAQARLNIWNLFYLAKHTAIWTWNLLRHRPAIAHYAINGGSALWKSLLFFRLARWFGARTVGHLHSGGFLDYWGKLSVRKRQKTVRQFAQLDAFVVLSNSWRTAMAKQVGVSPKLLHVVNNPIDAQFEDAALAMPLERPHPNFLGMGILSHDKGAFDLLAASARLQAMGAQFKVYLAGPERETGVSARVRKLVERDSLQDRIEQPGSVHGAAKLALFRECAISVLPSYYENFPLVLLEAAAAGHAIITTPVGAVPEFFVDGVSALFVRPGDPDQLATAMQRLLSNSGERIRIARQARLVFTQRLARTEIMRSLHETYRVVLTGTDVQSPAIMDAAPY